MRNASEIEIKSGALGLYMDLTKEERKGMRLEYSYGQSCVNSDDYASQEDHEDAAHAEGLGMVARLFGCTRKIASNTVAEFGV